MRSKHGFQLALKAGASALAVMMASAGGAYAHSAETSIQDEPATQVDEIVVTGFRASLANALNIKRKENGVVDAISAEDIADFPDLNLAESLQRIPGVAITRRSGEGRQISVRGLGSDYTRVRVNGMEAIATSSGTSNSGGTNRGRGFDFNIFSSDLFSNLIVRKTASAEVDEGSLGATVDLNAQRPFDSTGPRLIMAAQGSYNDLAQTVTPGVSFLASNRWMDGKLGALLSVSYDERHLIEEGSNITRWTYGGSNGGWNSASTVPGLTIGQINQNVTQGGDPSLAMYHPRIPSYASYDTESQRLGVAGSVQFRPTDSTTFSIDALYSDFQGTRSESQLQALGLSRPGAGKPQSIIRDGVLDGNNLVYAVIDNVDLRTQSSLNELNTTFAQITGTVDHQFSDRFRVKAMVGYSQSEYEDPIATTVTFERLDSDNFVYDFRQRMMQMNLNFDATDPNAWAMVNGSSEVRLTPERVENDYVNLKFASEYDFNDNLTFKVGADWKKFGYTSEAWQRASTTTVPGIAAGASIAALSRQFNFGKDLNLASSSVTSWLAPDLGKFIDQYDIYSNTGLWALRENTGSRAEINEETLGLYAQADFNFDAFGLPWRGDIGGRWFQTKQESGGNAAVGAVVEWVVADNKYDMFLPSANIAVDLTDTLIARASAAQTISRPGLGSLSPGGSVSVQGANRSFSTGNPYLDPTKSTNLDLSLEWYPESGSILAVGLFYKDIDTFVQTLRTEAVYSTLGLPNSLLDGTVATPDMVFAVSRPVNSDGGALKGIEINWQQPFTFLPGFWSDFGLLANYTYVNSDIEYLTSTNPADPTVNATLIGLSKNAWNGTLYYENDRFSARVSVAYRDGYLTAVPGNDFNSWHGTNATTNVDAQVSYNITDQLKVSLEGLNLTDEYADLYVDESNRLNAYTHTGRQYVVGLRYTF
ncbi:TonB-dependent receptor [Brevundimonas bullata]